MKKEDMKLSISLTFAYHIESMIAEPCEEGEKQYSHK